MNFLNKKHVQSFANTNKGFSASNAQQEESSFSPYTGSYINNRTQINKGLQLRQSPTQIYQSSSSRVAERQVSQYSSNYAQKMHSKSSLPPPPPSPSILTPTNICQQHENQILRHLCLQCNQLLCSQCISEHLQSHRQRTNTIPKIETINKLKKEMNIKAEKILQFMEDNNPKAVLSDISQLKYEAITKIHDMKEEVIKAFEEWCRILQKHVIEDMIEEKVLVELSGDMGKMKEQVLGLYNEMLGSQSVNAQTIRKMQGIDEQRLQAGYLEMFNRFSKTVLRSKFTFQIDWNVLMEAFEKGIVLKAMHERKDSSLHRSGQNSIRQAIDINSNPNKQAATDQHPNTNNQNKMSESPQLSSQTKTYPQEQQLVLIQSVQSMLQPTMTSAPNQPPTLNKTQNSNTNGMEKGMVRKNSSKQRLAIFATNSDNQIPDQNSSNEHMNNQQQ